MLYRPWSRMVSIIVNAINHDSATPVYRQLAAILRQRIRSGKYAPGQRIPSEKDLEDEFKLARGTLKKAIGVLRDEGLVHTVQGKGSFTVEVLPPEPGEE